MSEIDRQPSVYSCDWMGGWVTSGEEMCDVEATMIEVANDEITRAYTSRDLSYYLVNMKRLFRDRIGITSRVSLDGPYSPTDVLVNFFVPSRFDEVNYKFSDFWRLAQPIQRDMGEDCAVLLARWVFAHVRATYLTNPSFGYLENNYVRVGVVWPGSTRKTSINLRLFWDAELLLPILEASAMKSKRLMCQRFANWFFDDSKQRGADMKCAYLADLRAGSNLSKGWLRNVVDGEGRYKCVLNAENERSLLAVGNTFLVKSKRHGIVGVGGGGRLIDVQDLETGVLTYLHREEALGCAVRDLIVSG